MKQISIVGIGMSADTLTAEGKRAVEDAQIILGSPRLIKYFDSLGKPTFAAYTPDAVAKILNDCSRQNVCILVSGDTGFYSTADNLCTALTNCKITLVPGVSSLNYFCARLKMPWQDIAAISCHGRKANIIDTVRRNKLTFALIGKNLSQLAQELTSAGFGDLKAYVGECLGTPQEQIRTLNVSEIFGIQSDNLAVLLIENPNYDDGLRFGIPDNYFIRGDVPMTKAEVRAVTMSKLNLYPNAICWDIGSGTGSTAVEMALAAYKGHVYALDHNQKAIKLIKDNCHAFKVGNLTPILGKAPEDLSSLPPPDIVFIGGSNGRLSDIFCLLLNKNPKVRIVVNAVTLETLHQASKAFLDNGIKSDIVQLGVTQAKPLGEIHMLQANNPVFILSGGGLFDYSA